MYGVYNITDSKNVNMNKTNMPINFPITVGGGGWVELGAGVPELRHILPEPVPEPENSGKNSGRQNYEKLFHISTNIWH
jgi:hypothetical protein